MNGFTLANASSINLNFLIYINNLYINYNESQNGRFPWLPIESSVLLNNENFDFKAKNLWNHIFDEISNPQYLIEEPIMIDIDIDCWHNNKFAFDSLFNMNSMGTEAYRNIKKSFESWYWGTGNQMNDIFSDNLVEDYYYKLKNMADANESTLKDKRYYLQVVYDQPPRGWKNKNENMIILSPNMLLPSITEIFEICKED